ncbi:hypothetical protein KR084_001414 [Drosophila pseudotakahashii]|nr:hypothetical protein KR084_001414 [Drosophila pseudotakahashii]
MPKILSFLAICTYFILTPTLFAILVPCVVYSIRFSSWEKCEEYSFETNLIMSAFTGASGLLWVTGNHREYHFLYNWLIVIAELIVLEFFYIAYAHILLKAKLWQWHLLLFGELSGREDGLKYLFNVPFVGFLIFSFILVLLHVLVSKKIIKNRLIGNLLTFVHDNTDVLYQI